MLRRVIKTSGNARQDGPDFGLPCTRGDTLRLSAMRGKRLALYIYPNDKTPGCTTRERYHELKRAQCEAWASRAIRASRSRSSPTPEKPCTQFGLMTDKNIYGKKVRGIERSTFVIDGEGKLAREWRGVKVPGHEEVLSFAKAL
ncbi:MAG: peroxiredoxin [Burkholderiales bacterium]